LLVEADSVEPAKLPRANRIDLIVWRENALPCVSIKDKKTDYRVDERKSVFIDAVEASTP